MTNQNSPFASDTTKQAPASDDFSFRTMQDDAASLENGPHKTSAPAANVPFSSGSAPANPFLEDPTPSGPAASAASNPLPKMTERAPQQLPQQQPLPSKVPAQPVEIPLPKKPAVSPSGNTVYKMTLSFILIVIVVLLGAGGYYFWIMKKAPSSQENQSASQPQATETTAPAANEPETTQIPSEKFSAENPNYLTLDPSTLDAQGIKDSIVKAATELEPVAQSSAYEFVAVDSNNNPVAFPIFATAAKLKISPEILANLGEKFSFFLYKDGDNMRAAFAVEIKDQNGFKMELPQQEKTLPSDISLMFLESKPEISSGAFKDGSYNGIPTRYLNLNSQGTLSIDYAVADNKFILGTSKNSLRAALDKLSIKPAAPAPVGNINPASKDSANMPAPAKIPTLPKTTASQPTTVPAPAQ